MCSGFYLGFYGLLLVVFLLCSVCSWSVQSFRNDLSRQDTIDIVNVNGNPSMTRLLHRFHTICSYLIATNETSFLILDCLQS